MHRQIDDLRTGHERGLVWAPDEAERAIKFFGMLRHWKGDLANKPIILEPWQEECIIRPLFGWRRPNGKRRFRTAYIEVPRKNGKTSLAAGVALFGLMADRERGAEVYLAAFQRDQARIAFNDCKRFVQRSPQLMKRLDIWEHHVDCPGLESKMLPLAAEGRGLHGLNVHMAILDELHVHRSREVFDVVTSGRGARSQPLILSITTAGHDRTSICWDEHKYAELLLSGGVQNDAAFAFVSQIEDGDDPYDRDIWRKANPNLGVSKTWEYLEEETAKAKSSVAYENTVLQLDFNRWTEQAIRWLSMPAWDDCKGHLPDLRGRPCWAGLDLGNTRDTNALALLFRLDDGRYAVKVWFWVPESSLSERAHQDRRQLLHWADAGLIRKMPGATTEYGQIVDDLLSIAREYQIQEVAYDPWSAPMLIEQLRDKGFPVSKLVEVRQTISHLTAATKELDRLVSSRGLLHDGNQVLRWMASNVVVRADTAGNLLPDKERSATKIDGISAMVMALARIIVARQPSSSVAARGYVARF